MSAVAAIERVDSQSGLNAGATPFSLCLEPLLALLRWRGMPRQLAEATGFQPAADLVDLRNVLARLGFSSRVTNGRLRDVDVRLLPCLFQGDGRVLVAAYEGKRPGTLTCFDAQEATIVEESGIDLPGTLCFFQPAEGFADAPVGKSWIGALLRRFEFRFWALLGITLALNLLALVPAFFVQAVYDKVLPSRSLGTLAFLSLGIALAFACDLALRLLRGAIVAHLGGRLDFLIGSAAIVKMLRLPLQQLERGAVGGRLAMLREFEAIRNVFAGPILLSVLEIPFVFVFIAALTWMGGWLTLVPILSALLIGACGFTMIRYARARLARSTAVSSDVQTMMTEILANFPAIKAGGTEAIWQARFRERSAELAFTNLAAARVSAVTDVLAYTVNLVAGAATLIVGAMFAMDGDITVGVLIASMTLVWRVLAPFQVLFVTATRVEQVRRSATRIDEFLAAPSEDWHDARGSTRGRRFAGRVTLDRVFFRYDQHSEPAVASVSFEIKPGEIVAIAGGNGSGKSSVLKLVAALYRPQAGSVAIDGIDTRQLNVSDLRNWVTYLPQRSDLFPGTIRENLRLGNPSADHRQIVEALAGIGLSRAIDELPLGLDTPVDGRFSAAFTRKLVLARTLLMDASVILLDEPGVIDDSYGDDLLLEQLDTLRGRTTVILATHQPHQIQAADRVIVLRRGAVVHDGSPLDLMKRVAEVIQ